MADISRSEMGLIIGIVLGTLSVALAAVVSYVMYDNKRTKRNAAFRFHAAGSDARMPPTAADHNWTTINNSMVGLEMCETTPSHSGPAVADSPTSQLDTVDGTPPRQQGTGGSIGRTFLTALLGWTLPRARSSWSRSSPRGSPQGPGGALTHTAAASMEGHVVEAVAAGGSDGATATATAVAATAAAAAVVVPDVVAAKQRSSGRYAVEMAPLHAAVLGGEAELAVVMVQLCDSDESDTEPGGADGLLPASGCTADAVVSLTLAPSVSGSHPADTAAFTFTDADFANATGVNGVAGKAGKSGLSTRAAVRKLAAPPGWAPPAPCSVGSGVAAATDKLACLYGTISSASWNSETSSSSSSCIVGFEVVTDGGPLKVAQLMGGRMPTASAVVTIMARAEDLSGPVAVGRQVGQTEV